ncbi:MAG TPA: hypothetical protein VE462_11355 [Propionibacteriaceae bacterium]|jgi:hypothetical protein|nr:hypothetical protein [Propionibacteriaceae bacterium]
MIEVLYFEGCPNYVSLAARLQSLLDAARVDETIVYRRIDSPEQAEDEQFLGSPTVRVNGVDVDPGTAGRHDYGLMCRLYATADGLRGTPPDNWIMDALEPGV